MDYLDELLASCEARAAIVEKPIAVEVDGIGKFFVRPRLVAETEAMDEAVHDGDVNRIARGIAALVCLPDGSRIEVAKRNQFAAVFARLPLADMIALGTAASGEKKKDAASGN